ncbi:hypothetical protein D3C87_1565360 [compost metagenome]
MQGIKPATGLVNTLCNEIGREIRTVIYFIFMLKRIMPLCIRHGTRVKPNINQVALPLHRFARFRNQYNLVYHIFM